MNVFKEKRQYSLIETVGIGLTNKCNLNCEHCYSRRMAMKEIDVDEIQKILVAFPNLKSVNFGTGESILNRQFEDIVKLLYLKRIKMAITSNGLSVNKMSDEALSKFEDVDLSLDFPTAELHDKWRRRPELFKDVVMAIKRCKKFKINVSIVSVLMANNFNYFAGFKKILDKYDIYLRINLYKAVRKEQFTPTYDQFWTAIKDISKNFKVASCSEPILSLFWEDMSGGSKCGNSVRVHPDGEISSCVYVKNGDDNSKFNHDKQLLPDMCKKCSFSNKCVGGCYGRRLIENRINLPDSYCPFLNDRKKPNIKFKKYKLAKDLIHSSYLCTIILK